MAAEGGLVRSEQDSKKADDKAYKALRDTRVKESRRSNHSGPFMRVGKSTPPKGGNYGKSGRKLLNQLRRERRAKAKLLPL